MPTTVHFLKKRIFVSFLTFTAPQPKLMMCLLTIHCENIFYSRQINKTFICYQKHLERYFLFAMFPFVILGELSVLSMQPFVYYIGRFVSVIHVTICVLHQEISLYYPCNYLCAVLNISFKNSTSPFVCHGTILHL